MAAENNIWDIKKQIEDKEHKWYSISVTSGQENLVIENLKERIKKQWLENDIIDTISPMINESSMKKGEKVIKQKKLYPWYIFVKCTMNDKVRYVVRNTPWVRLIVWADIRPIPLTENEYQRIIEQIKKSEERAELSIPYKKWDLVSLKEGEFKGLQGLIKDIDQEKWTIIVNIEMLGRLTPVAVDAEKVELVS